MKLPPINLKKWLMSHRAELKPPVGNRCIYEGDDYIVMIVAGPNQRKDFHVGPYEEFFYQIEGDIALKVMEDNQIKEIKIKQGEMYVLPRGIPHSPHRPENTVGIVIEHKRNETDQDCFQWYCENCHHKLYEEYINVKNFDTELTKVFNHFYQDPQKIQCQQCGTIAEQS